MARSLLLMNHK